MTHYHLKAPSCKLQAPSSKLQATILLAVATSATLPAVAASATGAAAVVQRWEVETSRVQPVAFDVVRGETLALEAVFKSYGRPLQMPENGCAILWQTNGMGSAWWVTNAVVEMEVKARGEGEQWNGSTSTAVAGRPPYRATNWVVKATFTPQMDPGAASVVGFLGATGENYRAAFTLRFRHGPGAAPNALPLPTRTLDFATTSVAHPEAAPFALKGGGGGGGADTNAVCNIITNHVESGYLCTVAAAMTYSGYAASSANAYTDQQAVLRTKTTNQSLYGSLTVPGLSVRNGSFLQVGLTHSRFAGLGLIDLLNAGAETGGYYGNIVVPYTGSLYFQVGNDTSSSSSFMQLNRWIDTMAWRNGSYRPLSHTMADYGITNAYTKEQTDAAVAAKVDAQAATNIAASAAVTNGGAKAYADATFLKKGEVPEIEYSWMRTNDWTIAYCISNIPVSASSGRSTTNDYMVISNVSTTVTQARGGKASAKSLDEHSSLVPSIDEWRAIDGGLSIDSASGTFFAQSDGLYKISAKCGNDYRYADIAIQVTTKDKEDRFYSHDIASARQSVNDAALAVLNAATPISTNTITSAATGETVEYTLYDTFIPRMTSVGVGNAMAFAVSQHVLASANHYDNKITGQQTFDDGNGNVATVTKLRWVVLSEWAATNGFSEAEIRDANCWDICLILCDKTTAVPDACIPYFMSESAFKTRFADTYDGISAWAYLHKHDRAIPCVLTGIMNWVFSPEYCKEWHLGLGRRNTPRLDIFNRLKEMGQQEPIASGDSGRPVFVMHDNKPVIVSAFYGPRNGPSYVKSYNIIKKFVEAYGDTLKGIE